MPGSVLPHLPAHRLYSDRKQVPRALRGRQQWSWEGRKVRTGTLPEAALRVQAGGRDCWMHLFGSAQTEPYRQPFAVACRAFARLFCGPVYRRDYIYRPQARDEGGWRHSFQPLTLGKVRQHLLGRRILGTVGYRFTNHLTFDVDYHARDPRRELFLARCRVFHRELPKFFSTAWFATCKASDIGGAHFTVLLRTVPIAQAQASARRFLAMLDRKYPELAAVESFAKIEVYPVAKGDGDGVGCRLPLSQGRVCFTDRLLDGNPRANCVSLIQWAYDRKRRNVDAATFLGFLAKNTPEHEAPAQAHPQAPKRTTKPTGVGMGSIGRLRGRCLRALFDFWGGKAAPERDTIGKYAVVTARLICKQGLLDEGQCLRWLEEAFLALPQKAFSDRLSHDFAELMRSTRKVVEAVYRNNGYQAAPEESAKKLEAVIDYCGRHGVIIHDRSTWGNLPGHAQGQPDFQKNEAFRFSYEQRRVLKEEVHPLLYTEEIAATYEAASRIISFVRNNPGRELAWKLVPSLCGGLGIAWHKNKCCAFLAALVRVGFLYVRAEKLWRGKDKMRNRARSYGVGAALAGSHEGTAGSCSHGVLLSSVSIISHSDCKHETRRAPAKAGSQRLNGAQMLSGSKPVAPDRPSAALTFGSNGAEEVVRGPPYQAA